MHTDTAAIAMSHSLFPSADPFDRSPEEGSLGLVAERQLAVCRRNDTGLALLLIRLDGLGPVQRQCGAAVAERVLQAAWLRLKQRIRGSDLPVREGRAALGVVLPGANEAVAEIVAARLAAQLSEPYCVGATTVRLSVSTGTAVYPHEGITGEALLMAAAMAASASVN